MSTSDLGENFWKVFVWWCFYRTETCVIIVVFTYWNLLQCLEATWQQKDPRPRSSCVGRSRRSTRLTGRCHSAAEGSGGGAAWRGGDVWWCPAQQGKRGRRRKNFNIKNNKFEFMNLLKILILLRVVPKMLTRKECSRTFNCYQDYVNQLE